MKFARNLFNAVCEWILLIIFSAVLIIAWPLIRAKEESKDE